MLIKPATTVREANLPNVRKYVYEFVPTSNEIFLEVDNDVVSVASVEIKISGGELKGTSGFELLRDNVKHIAFVQMPANPDVQYTIIIFTNLQ